MAAHKKINWYTELMLRIALVGGGSGGHIYPLLAVATELQKQNAEAPAVGRIDLRYFGDPSIYRNLFATARIRISKIPASKWRAYASAKNLLDLFKFAVGFIIALWKLYWYMPNAVFSKGGPGALSIMFACRFYAIPIVLHETDLLFGTTNRLTARLARVIELSFLESETRLPPTKARTAVVGNPLRNELETPGDAGQAKKFLGLNPTVPVLLIIGGSQGAGRINDFILENLRPLLDRAQVLHQIGVEKYDEYKRLYEFFSQKWTPEVRARYEYAPYFSDNIGDVVDAADCILARAGGFIFEIAAKEKPAILVPLPESAHNHQVENAYAYAKTGAAVVIEEANLLPSVFFAQLDKIFGSDAVQKKMSEAARAFYLPNAAAKIAADILATAGALPATNP